MTVPDGRRERIAADPLCETLGIELVGLEPGAATTELLVADRHRNFHGTAHGGVVYALADAAFAAASNSRGTTAVALETNVSYLAAVDAGDRLRARATESHAGGRTAAYEVDVRRVSGDEAEEEGGSTDREGSSTEDQDSLVATFRGRVYRPDA